METSNEMAPGIAQDLRIRPDEKRASRREGESSAPARLASLPEWAFCATAVLAPLPFGSAEPFWAGVWCTVLALAIAGSGARRIERPVRLMIAAVLGVVALWVVVVVLQYAPEVWGRGANPAWTQASRLLGRPLPAKIAAVAELPVGAVAAPLSLVLALLAGLLFGADRACTGRLFAWVGYAGLAYAGYAIVTEIVSPTTLLWHEKTAYVNNLTGTFVNKNTAATFFGSIAIVWYVLTIRQIRRVFDLTRLRSTAYLLHKLRTVRYRDMRYLLYFIVVLGCVLMTKSRAGALLTIACLALMTVMYFARELRRGPHAALAVAAIALIGAVVLEIIGGGIAHQVDIKGLTDGARFQVYRSVLEIVAQHPWLGTGFGTFETVFPSYRTAAIGDWGLWDRAHSTPLELMAEMGLPFSAAMLALWGGVLGFALLAAVRRRRDRAEVIAGAAVGLLGTLHSLVDFSLQIPGYSIVCCALLGSAIATATASGSDGRRSGE
ncbi:MAG: O-antigen ligase family protein [Xanthobacteraceae bacterium]